MHVLFSILGFFRLDSRGKCLLITGLCVTILPDMLMRAEGTSTATGVTREISFLVLIIPITAVLGFWAVITYLDTINYPKKNLISLMVWVLVLLAVIIPPAIATTYYLPRISGEDYVIEGMQWLGNTGDLHEKVIGYGYRTIPLYTNMSDAYYGVPNGYETSLFLNLIRGVYFSPTGNDANDLRRHFGVGYILASDRLAGQFKNTISNFTIDNKPEMDKIYSSKDFGIYAITTSSEEQSLEDYKVENISFQQIGSSIQVDTDAYKVVLNKDYPIIERFGSPRDNYLGDGLMNDYIVISGLRESSYYYDPYSPLEMSASERSKTTDIYYLNTINESHEISNNQVIYRTVLKDQQNGDNQASLLVKYTFYPNTIKREFLISNDWVVTPTSDSPTDMSVTFRTKLFVPLNDFVIKRDQTSIKRHMYPSLDGMVLKEIFQDIYIHDGNRGIYIKNERTAPYPNELTYSGSTLYNMSSLLISQEDTIKPGATFHITQFLSPGKEDIAERNILTQDGISLSNFPDGKAPIILLGYRNMYLNSSESDHTIEKWYQMFTDLDVNVPYSEVMTNDTMERNPLNTITNSNTEKIVASISLSKFFENSTEQDNAISWQDNYIHESGDALIGYIPSSLRYNLDTLKIISDKNISFIISNTMRPPYRGVFGLDNRNPQMAIYQNESINVVLLPVEYPTVTELTRLPLKTDNMTDNTIDTTADNVTNSSANFAKIYAARKATIDGIFLAWKAAINESALNNEMTLLIIRSDAIDYPGYSDNLRMLITDAKNNGISFSSPDVVAEYFKSIQNIQYSGSVNGDIASINMTNHNDNMVQNVTFKIVFPKLKKGNYTVSDGTIVKTSANNDKIIVYASTDIPAHTTKEIIIEPDVPREKIIVTLPHQPTEGRMNITIKDSNGHSIPDVDTIIDFQYYHPDTDGNVNIDLSRGFHTVLIQYPGYETYSTTMRVKGRYALIQQFFRDITGGSE